MDQAKFIRESMQIARDDERKHIFDMIGICIDSAQDENCDVDAVQLVKYLEMMMEEKA